MSDKSPIVPGIHAVSGLLKRHPGKIERIVHLQQRHDHRIKGLLDLARKARVDCVGLGKAEFDQALGSANNEMAHQGVVAFIKPGRISNESDLDDLLEQVTESSLFLLLDGVTDPQNLGACLRSANGAGVSAVILPKDRSAPLNTAARKVASGAAELTPLIRVTNLARTIKHMQSYGIHVVGAAGEAEDDIDQADLTGPLALVMGSEDKGLRRLTREHCDTLVKIPMVGEVGSFNVSVATGICLFEILRQRRNR